MELILTTLAKRIETFQENFKLYETSLTNLRVEKHTIAQELSQIQHKIDETAEPVLKQNLLKTYHALKHIIDANVLKLSNAKKCRYYDRGYCKFQDGCSFVHPLTICQKFLQKEVKEQCNQRQCKDRHPKNCKYWSREEGCRRGEYCQYLHQQNKLPQTSHQTATEYSTNHVENNMESITTCRNEFENEDSLRVHTETTHVENAILDCNECDFRTESENILQCHIQEVHPFQCNKCDFKAKIKGWLTRHTNATHHIVPGLISLESPDDSYVCDLCDFETNDESELTTHEQLVHDKENSSNTNIENNENTTTRWTTPKEPPPSWSCMDKDGKVHGPFQWYEMLKWYNSGGNLLPNTLLKREGDENFATLEEVQRIYGTQPFFILEPVN